MKNKVKFALVGCGRISERHLESIVEYGELVAVCDIIVEKAQFIAEKFPARVYSSLEEMLSAESSNIDFISICTPNGLHAEHSILALNFGVNVLCEKPMALTVKDCLKMISTAEMNNRRLFAVKQNRFNPPVAKLKELLDDGKLGRILSVQLNCFWNRNSDYYSDSWKGSLDLDGGILFTQFSHFIDLLLWLVGNVKSVKSFMRNSIHKDSIEFDDNGVVVLDFENGAIGGIHFTINSFAKNMEGSITIFGENGTVKIGGQYLNELEYQNIQNFIIENLPEGNKANNYGSYQGSMSNHRAVYENLISVLENGASIKTNAIEALMSVDLIEKIHEASKH